MRRLGFRPAGGDLNHNFAVWQGYDLFGSECDDVEAFFN
jgi:hypothetical protein